MVVPAYPDWVLELDDDRMLRLFGAESLRRGRVYAAQSRVSGIRPATNIVAAQVAGNGYHPYQTTVAAPTGVDSLVTSCSCPVRRNCKHAVALILHMRTGLERRAAGPVAPAAGPSWQQALTPLVGNRATRSRGGGRLALQLNQGQSGFWLRPLRSGTREPWVRSGAEWEDMRFGFGGQLAASQREPLARLLATRRTDAYGAHQQRITQLMLADLRPEAWVELRQAVQSGVDLLPGSGLQGTQLPPIELIDDAFVPTVVIDQVPAGLQVTTMVVLEGREFAVDGTSFVGYPANGVALQADDRLLLGPLSRELTRDEHSLFARSGIVEVPNSDVGLFASGFLPRLRDRLEVRLHDGVELPEPSPPTLVGRIQFAAVGATDLSDTVGTTDLSDTVGTTDLSDTVGTTDEGEPVAGGARWASVDWGYRYRIGEQTHLVSATPRADDPPVRDLKAEAGIANSLPAGPWRTQAETTHHPDAEQAQLRSVTISGRALITFVTDVLPALAGRDDVELAIEGQTPAFREAETAPEVSLRVTEPEAGDWFNLGVEITVDGEQVPFEPLFRALSLGEDHLMLDSGTWFSLDRPELDQLRRVIEEARGIIDHDDDTFRLRPEHAGLWEELVSLGVVAEQSDAWREAASALLDVEQLPEIPEPAGLNAELRPYQNTGLRWLAFLWRSRLGGILADEMGLGKTVQALALAKAAEEAGELTAPLLVVAPTSVVATWAAEAEKFTPELRVVAITQTESRRGEGLADAVAGAQVVLTSYTLLRLEADSYHALEWSAVLLDEAQFVKNRASKAYQAVRKLRARTKIALTGTPLENNLMDLWSLLSITAPGLFADPKKFGDVYRKPIEGGNNEVLERLHRRIRPLILRRTKAAVATELPEKQEQIVPIELSPSHRKIYDKHLARERQKILGLIGDVRRNRITILRSLTLLRQLALSPALVKEEHAEQSAKIDVLVERLSEVIAEGHRALVFSQFTGFLGLVRDRLAAEGIAYEYLDGRTRDRAARIAAFREGDAPAFLISLKAGGFGLTLTEADYVFILDPWWNPATEAQAIDRTHRIGQDKPVNVYRLVAMDTIEEKVVALQERKRDLFDAVVGAASDLAAPLSAEDIRGLLEH
ncbi:SNF2-related protein [Granulicoccus sp. GXG6511]|uniref:DEAD/DEAH box helicase n=1 Tax=Granulicoccus sp. GXG6511 TaxID=3381351 RepID=UPI003D7DDAE6